MPKIDLYELIETNLFPTNENLKLSFGNKDYLLYEKVFKGSDLEKSQALIKFGKELEGRKSFGIGYGRVYKSLLCYALAAKLQNLNAFKSFQLVIRKQLFRHDIYDPQLVTLLEQSHKKENELKERIKKDMSAKPVGDAQLDSLLLNVNTFDNVILAERLDLAFEIYKRCYELSNTGVQYENIKEIEKAKNTSIKLMETILNVEGEKKILRLMNTRIAKRKLDPEFIPGKRPKSTTKLPNPLTAKNKAQYQWRRLADLALGHRRGKILAVKEAAKIKDMHENTRFLKPAERDEHRVIIRQGKFYQRQPDNEYILCDTRERVSHEKSDYAAYTINMKGELSLFDHFEMADGFAHSSMNAQAPVFAAGEIQIIDGKLSALTVYSRHYNPTLLNIYEALSYFHEQGVDLSKAKIQTWGENNVFTANMFIEYQAKEFFEKFKISGLQDLKPLNAPKQRDEIFEDDLRTAKSSLSKQQADFNASLKTSEATVDGNPFDDFETDFNAHLSSGMSSVLSSEGAGTPKEKRSEGLTQSDSLAFDDFEVDFESNLPQNVSSLKNTKEEESLDSTLENTDFFKNKPKKNKHEQKKFKQPKP